MRAGPALPSGTEVAGKDFMPPSGASYHFAISLGLAFLAGPAWALLRRSHGAISMAVFAFLAAMTAGLAKEVHDLIANPWRLSPADLRADSACDMGWNLAGSLAGVTILLVVLAAVAVMVRHGAGSASRPARTACPAVGLPPPRSPA